MRAIPFEQKCDANDLKITDWPDPTPGEDEVLIRVKAFGLNYADIMARQGQYPDAPGFPFIPGYEVAGTVEALGPGVKGFRKGDKVLAFTPFGGYAELAITKTAGCFKLPPKMSFVDAASIPVNFATAYHSLHHTGQIGKGSHVLIHAAAGGVGLSAIQLARLAGATIYGTAGSDAKLDLIKGFGVHHPINYRTQEFDKEIMRLTDNEGIDIILDSIGGSYLKKGAKILRPHGRIVAFGVASISNRSGLGLIAALPQVVSMLTLNGITFLSRSLGFYGVNMKAIGDERPEVLAEAMTQVLKLFKARKIKTVVNHKYSWQEIGAAHELIQSRKSTGKIVLTVD